MFNTLSTLSPEQKLAIDLINSGKNVFLTGGGGTGKSYIIDKIVSIYKSKYASDYRKYLGVTSLTGSSALLIGGITIHSFSGIGVRSGSDSRDIEKIIKKPFIKKRWSELQAIIIDEISMMTPRMFRLLHLLGQSIKKNYLPFGGIQLILSGDFCQLSPILEDNMVHTMEYCFETDEWKNGNIFPVYFKTIHRQRDTEFINVLQKIRLGISDIDTTSILMSRFKAELTNPHGILPTKLYPTREKVNQINDQQFLENSGDKEVKTYKLAFDFNFRKDKTKILPDDEREMLSQKIANNLPINYILNLCVGLQVILVVNMDIDIGLVNGSKGVVVGFAEETDYPIVEFSNGVIKTIDLYKWDIENVSEYSNLTVKVSAIPLVLGYACTIHKSQGMTIDLAVMDIGKNVFTGSGGYGQVYVALSRVRSLSGLSLINYDPNRIRCHPKVIEYYRNLDKQPVITTDNQSNIQTLDNLKIEIKKKSPINGQTRITSFFKIKT
jgi:ATP-dependent DNA helicase PIF1